jgi:hypothetical protein
MEVEQAFFLLPNSPAALQAARFVLLPALFALKRFALEREQSLWMSLREHSIRIQYLDEELAQGS